MSLPSLRTVLNKHSSPTASLSPSGSGDTSSQSSGDGFASYNQHYYHHHHDHHQADLRPGQQYSPPIHVTLNLTIPLTVNTTGAAPSMAAIVSPTTTPPAAATVPRAMTPHSGEAAALRTGYRHVHRKPKPKRNRKGWGPYQSVTRERAVDFNLTLDVQKLRQEIQQLTTARDLLAGRLLQLRHSPSGSLMQMVREYYNLFRTGFRVEEHARRRHVITAGMQRDYLYSVVDKDIDFGNGLVGVEILVEMLRRYSLFMRFISMDLHSFSIVTTGENQGVVIHTKGPLRFQVLRETVATIFPHVLGNEWLCSRLIGAEVVAAACVTFHINANDKIFTLVPDADYVAAFSQILPDPADVLELLGQSKITDQSMLGVTDDGQLEELDPYTEPEPEALHAASAPPAAIVARKRPHEGDGDGHVAVAVPRPLPPSAHRDYVGVATRYVLAFANGWPVHAEAGGAPCEPRLFLDRFVSPQVVSGRAVGHAAIERGWKTLCASFDLVGFHATSKSQLHDDGATVSVRVRVAYALAIDITTVQTLFPHILRFPKLVQALLGGEITCPGDLWLEWTKQDGDAALVARLRERLNWDAALTPLLPKAHERGFVLDQARLTPQGCMAVPLGGRAFAH